MSLRDRVKDRIEERWANRIGDIAAEEIENGATQADLEIRVRSRLQAEAGGSRPFLDFLMQLFVQLLPMLLKLLGGIGGLALPQGVEDNI